MPEIGNFELVEVSNWKIWDRFEFYLSRRLIGKPTICIGENKGADQLCSNCEADQRLCFRFSDGTIPFLLTSKISSFWPSSVLVQTVQLDLCQTWSETLKTGFLELKLT